MSYRTEAPLERKKCPHGLMYDPATQEGCVVCRRDPGVLPDVPEAPLAPIAVPARVPSRLEAVLVTLGLAALFGGATWLVMHRDGARGSGESKCRSLAGSPGKCIELCVNGCPAGTECQTVTFFDGKHTRREGQCVAVEGGR